MVIVKEREFQLSLRRVLIVVGRVLIVVDQAQSFVQTWRLYLRLNVDLIPTCADSKVRLSRRRATEAVSPSHRRLRRCPACPELSEGRLIASHLSPPVSRRAATTCGLAFRVRRFQRASCPVSGRAGPYRPGPWP